VGVWCGRTHCARRRRPGVQPDVAIVADFAAPTMWGRSSPEPAAVLVGAGADADLLPRRDRGRVRIVIPSSILRYHEAGLATAAFILGIGLAIAAVSFLTGYACIGYANVVLESLTRSAIRAVKQRGKTTGSWRVLILVRRFAADAPA